jgi:hypothetical protein
MSPQSYLDLATRSDACERWLTEAALRLLTERECKSV